MMDTPVRHRDASGGNDAEILDRIRERDSAALRTLFQRYYSRVYWFVQRRLHDANLAEEVVADVFFEVWRSAHSIAGASHPTTWIFGIAHFKCVGAHRDRRRHKRASVISTALAPALQSTGNYRSRDHSLSPAYPHCPSQGSDSPASL
jgi:DNA-directed RNA polymerase specialized sigma24 family protein